MARPSESCGMPQRDKACPNMGLQSTAKWMQLIPRKCSNFNPSPNRFDIAMSAVDSWHWPRRLLAFDFMRPSSHGRLRFDWVPLGRLRRGRSRPRRASPWPLLRLRRIGAPEARHARWRHPAEGIECAVVGQALIVDVAGGGGRAVLVAVSDVTEVFAAVAAEARLALPAGFAGEVRAARALGRADNAVAEAARALVARGEGLAVGALAAGLAVAAETSREVGYPAAPAAERPSRYRRL